DRRGDRGLLTAALDVTAEYLEGLDLAEDPARLVGLDHDMHEADSVREPEGRVVEALGALRRELRVDGLDECRVLIRSIRKDLVADHRATHSSTPVRLPFGSAAHWTGAAPVTHRLPN